MKRPMKIVVGVLVVLVIGQGVFTVRLWRASAYGAPALARLPSLRLAQEAGEWRNSFLGISLLQFPTDLMTYQRLLFDAKPDIVIETGTYRGGLSLYLAMLLHGIHLPITTPFYPDGALYLKKLEANVAQYSKTPAAGIVALGSTGEAVFLSEEGKELLKVKNHPSVKDDIGYKVEVTGDIDRATSTISIKSVIKLEEEGASCSRVQTGKKK